MALQHVDIVEVQTLEGRLDRREDVLAAQTGAVGALGRVLVASSDVAGGAGAADGEVALV